MKKIILLSILFLSAGVIFSADVGIVYNGSSGTNREAYQYIRNEFRRSNRSVNIKSVNAKNGTADSSFVALIVLNSGVSSGIDPVIQDFINKNDKSKIILVNLQKGSQDLEVKIFKPEDTELGVDAVTSASLWKGMFSRKEIEKMHHEWIDYVIGLVNGKIGG